MRELGRTRRVQGRTVGATGWGLPVSGPGGGQVLAQGPGCLHHGHRRVKLSLHRRAPACSRVGVLPSRKALFGVLGLATASAFPCCLSTAFSGAAPLCPAPRKRRVSGGCDWPYRATIGVETGTAFPGPSAAAPNSRSSWKRESSGRLVCTEPRSYELQHCPSSPCYVPWVTWETTRISHAVLQSQELGVALAGQVWLRVGGSPTVVAGLGR